MKKTVYSYNKTDRDLLILSQVTTENGDNLRRGGLHFQG